MDAEDPFFPRFEEHALLEGHGPQSFEATEVMLEFHRRTLFCMLVPNCAFRPGFDRLSRTKVAQADDLATLVVMASANSSETTPKMPPTTIAAAAISAGLPIPGVKMSWPVAATVPTVDAKPNTIAGGYDSNGITEATIIAALPIPTQIAALTG